MAAVATPIPTSILDGSIGCFVIGTALATFLCGITACQAWTYFQHFPNDKRLYKYLVGGLLIVDLVHTAVSLYTVYAMTVTHYGDLAFLVNCPWSFAIDPAMTGIVALACQLFYAYRVFVVGKRKFILPLIICTLSLVGCGFAIGATAQIFVLVEFSKFQVWTYGVSVWLGASALADVMITASLVWYLFRSKSTIVQTNTILDRLISLVISTNGLTAAVAVIDAALFGALATSWHVVPNLCLVKLYFNSLLCSLNARTELEKALLSPHNSRQKPSVDALYRVGTNSNGATSYSTFVPSGRASESTLTTALGFTASDCNNPALITKKDIYVSTHQATTTETAIDRLGYTNSPKMDGSPSDNSEKFGSPVIDV